ncbi:hypothetical protein [Halorubellus litoreus]|uniref:Uncharacterized protein n=1 Tax=Halorubellus litoreus TaxID=755308 RepID=A0ABD5VHW1_9EURY
MTSIYNNFKTLLFNGSIDLDADTLKVALVADDIAYTPDIDTEVYVNDVLDDVTASELNATNYARKTLAPSISQDNVDNEAVMDATNLTWSALGGSTDDTIQGALIYKEVTNDADSPVLAYMTSADFPLPTNGGDVSIEWDVAGVLTLG